MTGEFSRAGPVFFFNWSSIMTTHKFSLNSIVRFVDTKRGQRIVIGSAAVVLVIVAAAGLFYWNRKSLNERAQKAFMESIVEFEQALTGQEGISWSDVERTLEVGSREFASSSFGPYFKVFQADTALHQNKHDEAVVLLKEAVSKMSAKNPLYYLYRTKLALMLIDSKDAALHDEGAALLKHLAETSTNSYRDMALYYLGFYARAQDDQATVRTYWTQLMQDFGAESVWAQLVNEQQEFAV